VTGAIAIGLHRCAGLEDVGSGTTRWTSGPDLDTLPEVMSSVAGGVSEGAGSQTRPGVHSGVSGEAVRVRQLVAVFGPRRDIPPAVTLQGGPLQIGREGHAGVALDDDEVSRRHAELAYDPAADRWWIRDMASRNGTWVDGARVDRAALGHGAVVRIGQTLLVAVDLVIPCGQRLRRDGRALRGHSVAMQRVRGEIAMTAGQPMPLLVLGETGVGKELVARELHDRSGRAGPFVPVNCATIPRELADSELFGHAAGAFTGAVAPRGGLFAAADGGTLFLDEIGELPEAVQPKLLRALALGEVRAVGRTQATRVDVRVVAATHRDLAGAVAGGAFRADLYARLSGWLLRVPPLRDRRDDVLELARGALDRRGGKLALSCRAAEALLLHDWPFNVRELEHAIEAAAIRAEDGVIRCQHLPAAIGERVLARDGARVREARPDELAPGACAVPGEAELRRLLAEHRGNIQHVARALGKDRRQVYRWLRRHAIDVAAARDEPGD
jgi:DNA-binding NtrC family response regulator